MAQNSPSIDNIFVSVIIPIYNDIEGLKLCLESLARQTYPHEQTEIIVVDNDSDDGETIAKISKQYDQVIYTKESKVGSYAARNRGISIAKGEIIAFTDSDCIPHCQWLATGINQLVSTPNSGLLAGKINLLYRHSESKTPVELYESVMAFRQQEFIEKNHYGVTANILTWKQVIDRVGLFNSNLKSGGDLEWCQRVYHAGYQQLYGENVCVSHPARHSFGQLYKQTVRYTGGAYDLFLSDKYSQSEGFKLLSKYILLNLMPPVNFAINIFKNSQVTTISHKMTIITIFALVRLMTIVEIIRLSLGSNSSRQ